MFAATVSCRVVSASRTGEAWRAADEGAARQQAMTAARPARVQWRAIRPLPMRCRALLRLTSGEDTPARRALGKAPEGEGMKTVPALLAGVNSREPGRER
ncbi:hypothetical protein GCM10009727_73320 [Actinomadura napierensis]|uniref:Uncharacterized protein n=1 Tax=Actinomadura napierensis TaxID=267854 RepID=A0ABN3ACY3_9ACTN